MSSYCEQFRPYALTSNLVTCKPQAAKGQKWPATKPAGHRANLCKSCFQELVAAHCRSSHFKTGNSERSSARHSILIGCPQILNISQYRIPTCVSTYINTFSSSQHREVPGQLDNWPGKQRHKDSARNTKPLTAVKWKYVEAYLNKGGPENPKAKRQQTNLSNTDNWFISFSPLASFFLEDEHYGRIHCKFHFSPPAR